MQEKKLNLWDQNYAIAGYKYGVLPNVFVVEQSHRLPAKASVLVPGDGEGRNGVWLALQGHDVLSVDASRVGLEKARSLAEQQKVSLITELADLATWSPAPYSADAVVLTYVHLPPAIRQGVHQRLASALRPGGLIILEAFHPRQLAYSSGGPKAADMLYSLAVLRDDFNQQLKELQASEEEILLDEGLGHQGPAYVTRWVGQA